MIKVYIVDDHAVVIEGIYSLLQKEKDIEMAGYASNAANCLQYFSSHTADVILMDISLPDMNGVDLCKLIKKNYPGIMVLALSTFNQGTYIRKMMESGASGYLLKNAGRQEIIEAIKVVVKGKTYLSFDAGQALKSGTEQLNSIPPLTKREKEVLAAVAEGLTNMQIAEKLFISVDTVESHRKNLHAKLNVKNTAMLVRFALENDLL
ncbi:MAG: response regulator transcription factor [Chitinophagaceae bacterium]|jgi:DNA-binding NarL/FixJ family response regulator|nr:response regulator transcription factor [Chitinophagaceae bacterium]